MEFYSFAFITFVIICLIINEITGRISGKYQWIVRLIASLAFYLYIAKIRIIFLIISAVTVWYGGIVLEKIITDGKKSRKRPGITKEEKKNSKAVERKKKNAVVIFVLLINLGILAYVKYYLPIRNMSIVLPLGISYYTFMAISYLIDVYGEKYDAEKNVAKFLLFISWFPQIIEGPFNRYDLISKQLFGENRLTWECWKKSMLLFLFGAIKKYVVADVLAPSVSAILGSSIVDMPGSYLLFGAFLRAIQQYGDFSGGIDMVMSVSLMFGVQMSENFRQPYFSPTLAEFWRRWHMSLGSFMRDYVFYPFAMNDYVQKITKTISKKYGNHWGRSVTGGIANIFVFVLVGVWHGSQLHYVYWGLYHGIIIAISDALAPGFVKLKKYLKIKGESRLYKGFQMFRTFMIIVFAGYFDAIEDVKLGFACFKNTFVKFKLGMLPSYINGLCADGTITAKKILLLVMGVIIVFVVSYMKEKSKDPVNWLFNRPLAVRWCAYYFMIFLVLMSFTVTSDMGGFMYAAF